MEKPMKKIKEFCREGWDSLANLSDNKKLVLEGLAYLGIESSSLVVYVGEGLKRIFKGVPKGIRNIKKFYGGWRPIIIPEPQPKK